MAKGRLNSLPYVSTALQSSVRRSSQVPNLLSIPIPKDPPLAPIKGSLFHLQPCVYIYSPLSLVYNADTHTQ
jgi:hypothetical protein